MFKRGLEKPSLPRDGGENPWDASTVKNVCAASKLTLSVHHLERRYRDGALGPDKEARFGERSVIGTGQLKGMGQYIHVEVTFEREMKDFGTVVLDYQYDMQYMSTPINMPVVRVVLRDSDGTAAGALHEAMKDALRSGLAEVEMRCWVQFAPGSEDRSSTVYGTIAGVQLWSFLHKPALPSWARPIGEMDLSDYPAPALLREAPRRS